MMNIHEAAIAALAAPQFKGLGGVFIAREGGKGKYVILPRDVHGSVVDQEDTLWLTLHTCDFLAKDWVVLDGVPEDADI